MAKLFGASPICIVSFLLLLIAVSVSSETTYTEGQVCKIQGGGCGVVKKGTAFNCSYCSRFCLNNCGLSKYTEMYPACNFINRGTEGYTFECYCCCSNQMKSSLT
ncbi:hypothetical protein MKW98_009930 [Papaver atlanticum]|uniref:Uncharacterized protein n=1 Tax=Papaver atlanticum TaxID=357466 RepID=A0AAD4XQJ8_9MAGN|nr:hypothetical protein MKW98_009930 [Papaver atlanticum]